MTAKIMTMMVIVVILGILEMIVQQDEGGML